MIALVEPTRNASGVIKGVEQVNLAFTSIDLWLICHDKESASGIKQAASKVPEALWQTGKKILHPGWLPMGFEGQKVGE